MTVGEATSIARQWALEVGSHLPGFRGAFLHGSLNWLPANAEISPTSDVDVMVVLADPDLPNKPGKLIYRGVLLEISYLSAAQLSSPEAVLEQYALAGSLAAQGVLSDPIGWLRDLQWAVAQEYPRRSWVRKRCEQARAKVLHGFPLQETDPFHDQVPAWLFSAGVTTHILLVAGLKNPTVRRRYVAVRELLAEYDRLEFHHTLLEMLGCAEMTPARARHHLNALTLVFDAAKVVVKSPFFFASDISEVARPIAIDGSRELIARGLHREAIFWIVATYSRCLKILFHDAPPATYKQFTRAYQELLGDLGIESFADLEQRKEQVSDLVPSIWEVAEAIMAANPDIRE
jgi:hypothetical protein